MQRPFWQARYYDFNVFTDGKRIEKLDYIHCNPVKRGLVESPEDWLWSSCRYYQTGEQGRVEIELLGDHWKPIIQDSSDTSDGCPTFAPAYVGRKDGRSPSIALVTNECAGANSEYSF